MLMRVPDFVLEGDRLAAMQNARALHRMMNIMRRRRRTMPEFEPIIGRYLGVDSMAPPAASMSRRPAPASRCCACTRPAPTAGSTAIC